MGLFDKLFETKYCSICGNPIKLLGNKKLRDGNCCRQCESQLSVFFSHRKQATVAEIKQQILCRENNKIKLSQFNPTRVLGFGTKVLIDEDRCQFVITSSNNFRHENADVIDCSAITNCSIDIDEHRQEIKYQDSNGNTKSFNPPSYAYSYDFYVDITVNVPYINQIRFKINDHRINNGQKTLIHMEGGLLNKFTDALLPAKSFNGMTSNANEVRACAQYQKCEQAAHEIRDTLLSKRSSIINQRSAVKNKVVCPWCDSLVDMNDQGICACCCGNLNAT